MLFNLAQKNVKKNFNNYFIYFVSIVLNVVIYFTFESMVNNEQIAAFAEGDVKILMVFRAASIIIAIFSAVFIWYSTSFFIKKRKKEIGMYSLLGLKKRQIGTMLFYETLIMGLVALLIGSIIGSLLCKLFIMILIKFVGANIQVHFALSIGAVKNTLIVFGILFLIASISSYTVIYRFKLIELFKAEKVREKEPKASIVTAILSIIIMIIGYVASLSIKDSPTFYINFPIAIICCVIGSFMFFKGFLLFFIKSLKKKKYLYYKGENMISLSHLLYRIQANGRNLAIISLLNAAAIVSIGFGYSFYHQFKDIIEKSTPFSYSYICKDENLNKQVEDIFKKFSSHNKVLYSAEGEFIKLNANIGDLKPIFEEIGDENVYLISESKFNKIAKKRGLKDKIELKSKNDTVVLKCGAEYLNKLKGKSLNIYDSKNKDTLNILERKQYDVLNSNQIGLTLLVKDEVYNKYYSGGNIIRVKGYKVENEMDSRGLSKALVKVLPEESKISYAYDMFGVMMFSSMIFFIGIFLGLVFIASTGSIIYFKQLTEANEDKERYTILKKVGLSNLQIKKSIKKQIFTIFAAPLIIGISHSLTAFAMFITIFNASNISIVIIMILIAYLVVYSIYYLLTVNSYYKVVNSN